VQIPTGNTRPLVHAAPLHSQDEYDVPVRWLYALVATLVESYQGQTYMQATSGGQRAEQCVRPGVCVGGGGGILHDEPG
jgi:hypothetical protein